MRGKFLIAMMACASMITLNSCQQNKSNKDTNEVKHGGDAELYVNSIQNRLNAYEEVPLTADLSHLSENQKKALGILIDAGNMMNDLFWYESYGNKGALLDSLFWYMNPGTKKNVLEVDREKYPDVRKLIEINYGPWDRLDDNISFVPAFGPKPLGANFYPVNMTKEQFDQWDNPLKKSPYTLIRWNNSGQLEAIPYHQQFERQLKVVSEKLKEAANLVENEGFKKYLNMRAEALLVDNYQPSDLAWMDMKGNDLDIVIGPIENYEDKLYGYKAAHEAFVLIKDKKWSEKLDRFAKFLPELQKNLPVEEKYKKEVPGTSSDLGAYDAVFYAGDCNAGSKTIAINLPNDEAVQLQKGTRRLQLKNVMKYKFDKIMVPISNAVIADEQQQYVNFDAFFANTMFHEVAHGLGIKNTITGKGTVRDALKSYSTIIEEGKADILGLYMIEQLKKKGEIQQDLKENYTTFLAGIFRSIRFGSASSHGKANLIRFNFFNEHNAFQKNPATGKYTVDYVAFEKAMTLLSEKLLMLQGNGDLEEVKAFVEKYAVMGDELDKDLNKINSFGVPKDIIFKQGKDVLGLM
ncbi:dipeptidyl-peptidase 3 family protein [Aureibacter tunicatorum]|uniref:Peptidase family M49 n=1 Tax=Aureibacter tunicatorum TaxID=866807 RepID=A0AAE3XIH1_9BACT|nr:Zn-dependent hydrolase [Aureibacter tunicatorum]MDR6237035.1 hypothetical protein [Aureibacter tunicatorum]BDD06027.1 hypothetical protein AUTU_35100 [Aureibacter tunicatorum]